MTRLALSSAARLARLSTAIRRETREQLASDCQCGHGKGSHEVWDERGDGRCTELGCRCDGYCKAGHR